MGLKQKLTALNSTLLASMLMLPAAQAAKLGDMDIAVNGYLTAGMTSSDNDRGEFLHTVDDDFSFGTSIEDSIFIHNKIESFTGTPIEACIQGLEYLVK